jgi:hypothetical protein
MLLEMESFGWRWGDWIGDWEFRDDNNLVIIIY